VFWRTVVRQDDEFEAAVANASEGKWQVQTNGLREVLTMLGGGASWSGGERNHLYFGGLPGGQFAEVSVVSGLDDPGDTRAFALIDLDHDGWQDMILAGLSAPRFRLMHNELASRPAGQTNGFVALRLVGGNDTDQPSAEWTARDGLGVRVDIELADGRHIVRTHRTDDGFKTQHSATMLIGVGGTAIAGVRVHWPSGKTNEIRDVASGSLLTVHENAEAAPSGKAITSSRYGAK